MAPGFAKENPPNLDALTMAGADRRSAEHDVFRSLPFESFWLKSPRRCARYPMRLVKQLAGALLALSLAVIRPVPSELGLAVPHAPLSWHSALGQALHAWTSKVEVEPASPFEGSHDAAPTCECVCNGTERLPVPEAVVFVALGFSLWPFLDLLHLLKKAWQKQVSAAERRLLLRPPDRP